MSRFFKSAAFPILIVVVLAFFAQKLIGSSNHGPNYTFGNLLTQLDNHQVKNLSLDQKSNSADVTLANGQKYSVGYPGLLRAAADRRGARRTSRPSSTSTSRASPPTAGSRC